MDCGSSVLPEARNINALEETVWHRAWARVEFVAVLERFDLTLMEERPEHLRNAGFRERTLVTRAGELSFKRRCYRDEETGKYRYLLDEAFELAPRVRLSDGLVADGVALAAEHSFRQSAGLLDFRVSHVTLHFRLQRAGAALRRTGYKNLSRGSKGCWVNGSAAGPGRRLRKGASARAAVGSAIFTVVTPLCGGGGGGVQDPDPEASPPALREDRRGPDLGPGEARRIRADILERKHALPGTAKARGPRSGPCVAGLGTIAAAASRPWAPRSERDRGKPRNIEPEVLEKAVALGEELPERSARQIIDILTLAPEIRGAAGRLKRSTLSRHLTYLGKTRRLFKAPKGPFRRYEKDRPNAQWQSDVWYGPNLADSGNPGTRRRTYLIAFLDNHSRLVTHGAFYPAENLENLLDCFRKAISQRGLPARLLRQRPHLHVPPVLPHRGRTRHPPYLGPSLRPWGKGRDRTLLADGGLLVPARARQTAGRDPRGTERPLRRLARAGLSPLAEPGNRGDSRRPLRPGDGRHPPP